MRARIIGRPVHIGGLDALLQQVKRHADAVCVVTREAIARRWCSELAARVS